MNGTSNTRQKVINSFSLRNDLVHFPGPVCSLRHRDLKTCPRSRFARLADSDTGDTKDFTGKEEPETGILSIPAFEDLLLLICRDTIAIILAHDDRITVPPVNREPDGRDLSAVPHRIVHQVVKYLDNQRVGKHFCTCRKIVFQYDLPERGFLCRSGPPVTGYPARQEP